VDRRAQDRQRVYFVPHVSFENKFSLSFLTFLSLSVPILSLSCVHYTNSKTHEVFIPSSSLAGIHPFSGGGAAAGAAAPPPETEKTPFFKKENFFLKFFFF
jgi:hypothetical protein